jgi:hypothetical protein
MALAERKVESSVTLAQLFSLEPAPIYGQFVKRISPLGPWEKPDRIDQRRDARAAATRAWKLRNRARVKAYRKDYHKRTGA